MKRHQTIKWWSGIVVEELSGDAHRIYFPEDQEVTYVPNSEIHVIEGEGDEDDGMIGKKVQVPYPAKDGHTEMWDGIVVGTVGNCYRVFLLMIAKFRISSISLFSFVKPQTILLVLDLK